MERVWIPCGRHYPRLELEGEVVKAEGEATGQLVRLTGFHIATRVEIFGIVYEKAFCELSFRPFELKEPLNLTAQDELVFEANRSWVVEGPESPLERLLDLVTVRGWHLQLVSDPSGWATYTLTMAADWEIASVPSILPGFAVGETSIIGRFHPTIDPQTLEEKCAISMAWPFSLQGQLILQNPHWSGTRWRANLDFRTMDGLIDGVGEAMSDFPIAKIGLAGLKDIIPDDSPLEDWLYLDASTNEEGFPTFAIELSTPEAFPLADFGGMKLMLVGRVAFVFEANFTDEYLNINFYITFSSESSDSSDEFIGFRLEGPLIQKIEEFASSVRSAVALLPVDDLPQLPEIAFEYELPKDITPEDIRLGDIDIPLNWQSEIKSNPAMNFLEGLPLAVPDAALAALTGFQLGNIQGDSPRMMMKIKEAKNLQRGNELGLALTIDLQFKIFDKILDLDCYWEMILDTQAFAFDPARHVSITVQTDQLRFGDLIIDGLDTLEAEWGSGGLTLRASELKAYYVGLSEPGDTASGFELLVEDFVLDAGGLAMRASVVGGASKIDGIGETFTGAAGSIEIAASEVVAAEFMVQGALPVLDNATGKMQLIFGKGFKLLEANAEFQLGIHKKTDWWIEFKLDQLKLKVDTSTPKTKLVILITGMIAVRPPSGSGDSLLGWFKGIELSFTDLVLTSAFDRIPPGLNLVIELNEPKKIDFLGVFQFELRSVGLGTGFDPGQVALSFGGQIFFSSEDKENPDPGLHVIKIGQPAPGKFLPRIRLNRLPLNMSIGQSIKLKGFVEFLDEPGYKGFKGMALMQIEGKIGIQVIVEISKVRRESDQKDLRVWMAYIEVQDLNIPLVYGFYLRDVGVGFGWRKTLQIMDRPNDLLEDPTKTGLSIGPHLPESWVNYLEGEKASWTVVLSSWISLGLGASKNAKTAKEKKAGRKESLPLVGDFIFALRSDLTIVGLMRAWVFESLDKLKSKTSNPPMKGLIYYSARNDHFIAAYIVNPALASPEGIPPALIESILGPPFNFNLETRRGYLRFDLGWPRQLRFPLHPWTGWAGIFFRKQPGSLSIGLGFEIGIFKNYNYGINFGIGSLGIYIYIRIGIYGMIGIRIGNLAAIYGVVGIHAIIRISLSLRISFKIGWFRIRFSIGYSLELIIAARVEFGLTERGFGMAGYASASLRIWKFSFSASVSFVINGDKLAEARRRLNDGGNYFGSEPLKLDGARRIPLLPELPLSGPLPVPAVNPADKRWRTFYMISPQKDRLFVLLLPDDACHLPTPDLLPQEEATESSAYRVREESDLQVKFKLQNLRRQGPEGEIIQHRINWNLEIPPEQEIQNDDQETQSIKVGDLYYESQALREERALMYYNIRQHQPEILEDPRVRQVNPSEDDTEDFGVRPDVRSPKFTAKNSLYDLVLENASNNEKDEILSWRQMALAMSGWENEAYSKDVVRDALPDDLDVDNSPADPVSKDYWRKYWLETAETLMTGQTGVISRLLKEFRAWSGSGQSLDNYPLLQASGLASAWEVIDPNLGFSLEVSEIDVYTGAGSTDHVASASGQIEPSIIGADDQGLGFATKGWDYKIRDIIEFQDRDSIHFSWEFEARDEDGGIYTMDHHLVTGIGSEAELSDFDAFEFFDYFRVRRLNLSRNEDPNESWKTWEVKPAYIPALQDMGSGEKRFFLLAPRFSFSDVLAGNENEQDLLPGDELLYSVSAVDVFGNVSQITEVLLERKNLEPPPAPTSVELGYEARISSTTWEENLAFRIAQSDEMQAWDGPLRFALYARVRPLEIGGFYGRGAGISSLADGEEGVPTSPSGLLLMWEGERLEGVLSENWQQQLTYGTGYEFFVQTISEEGNRSAMVRATVNVLILGIEEVSKTLTQAYLERIPPPDGAAEKWLDRSHIRGEAAASEYPVYSGEDTNPVSLLNHLDLRMRTVYLRFAHAPYLDENLYHPTGGYQLEVRDRDATLQGTADAYRILADVEVVSKEQYISSPGDTKETTSWSSNLIHRDQQSAWQKLTEQLAVEETLPQEERTWSAVVARWGEPMLLVPSEPEEELIPDDHWWHPALMKLISELVTEVRNRGYDWQYTGGVPGSPFLEQANAGSMETYLSAEEDPDGFRLLKFMGRSIEGTIMKGDVAISHSELKSIAEDLVSKQEEQVNWSDYAVSVELLLHGDLNTPLNLVRISLLPKVDWLAHTTGEDQSNAYLAELNSFLDSLNSVVISVDNTLLPDFDSAVDVIGSWLHKLKNQYATDYSKTVISGVTHFLDQGSYKRPVSEQGSVLIGLPYVESYARRYTYRFRKYSRYYYVYQEMGVSVEPASYTEATMGFPLRLPRIKPPEPPTVIYQGNKWRDGVLCSEWLLPAHEEEPRVQANETLRNRLGFRSLAWTLYSELKPGLMEASGWVGETTWWNRAAAVDDGGLPGLSASEQTLLRSDASPVGDEAAKPSESLSGHPFTDALSPKGLVVRIPQLPYYYKYQLAAFARTDDLDSKVTINEPATVFPGAMAQVDNATARWELENRNEKHFIKFIWSVPSVWDSLSEEEQGIWAREKPLATRLWDYDLRFRIHTHRNALRKGLLEMKANPISDKSVGSGSYEITTLGHELYWDHPGGFEKRSEVLFSSVFNPEIRLECEVTEAFYQVLLAERKFVFRLECFRTYGKERQSWTDIYPLPKKTEL